jgi:hypothetical protein
MNRAATFCAAVAVVLSADCGKSDSNSLVVVTVTAAPAMPDVTQLRAAISNAGSSDTRLFPPAQSATPIVFDTSFAVSVAKSRSGRLDIAIDALDSSSQIVATGSGSVDIIASGRADVTIHLGLVGTGDAGFPYADAGGDGGTGADVRNGDTTSVADVLPGATDARGGAGGSGGTGGISQDAASGTGGIGRGGATGTGGYSSTGGAAGTGGATATGGIKGSGGGTGTGGVTGTGGGARDGGPGGTRGTGGTTGIDGGGGAEPCTPAATITGSGSGNSGNFGTTGAYCFRTPDNITGWNCSNFTGRALKVNGVTETCGAMPLPAKAYGYYYFDSTGGTGAVGYASIAWY